MAKSLLWFILLASPFVALTQDFMVTESRAAYYPDGNPVKSGLPVDRNQHVTIRKRGSLSITYKKRWAIILTPGQYSLDSVIRVRMSAPEFITHDSIYTVLESKGLADCTFKYKYREKIDGAVNTTEAVDNIRVANSFLTTPYDTLTVRWKNPVAYTDRYYIVIYNLFEDMIGLYETNANQQQIKVTKYKKDNTILYKIIAEDCRASDMNAIRKGYKD